MAPVEGRNISSMFLTSCLAVIFGLNVKIVLVKNGKASFCGFRNCLVTANKESDNRNDCLLGVDWI